MLKEQFQDILAEFGQRVKQEISLDQENTATLMLDGEVLVNFQYLEESERILAFAPVGRLDLATDPAGGEKALELLRLNELGGKSRGFTLAYDEEAELVLAMDCRYAMEISSADALASWLEQLCGVVSMVRVRFEERFPEEV